MLLLLVCLVPVLTEDPLRGVLKSRSATYNLYNEFKKDNNLIYSPREDKERFKLFKYSISNVATYNEDLEDTGHYGVNFFSVLSPAEKMKYHGLNITEINLAQEADEDYADTDSKLLLKSSSRRSKILWTNTGHVTDAKNQKDCGCCWAFGAVAALETRYKIKSGVLRSFSAQEFVDCTYEYDKSRNGCKAGSAVAAFIWSERNGGRLAAEKDLPFKERDNTCKSSSTPNAMKAYKISGHRTVGKNEASHIWALQFGAVASVIEATDKFHQYDGSIMKDTTCKGEVNHLVTMVGYTELFILLKNSWGSEWGDRGFVRLTRNYDNCGLYTGTSYPTLKPTGESDSNSDPATNYRPPVDYSKPCWDEVPEVCEKIECCSCIKSFWMLLYVVNNCQKSCDFCERNYEGECPPGTVKCNDGVCRHEHMCH